jgi:hypothetical protein
MMISAEFPIAYGKPHDCRACKVEWESIIKQIRNHPCVFDYTMDNEVRSCGMFWHAIWGCRV